MRPRFEGERLRMAAPGSMRNGTPRSNPAGSGIACNPSPWNASSRLNRKSPIASVKRARKTASVPKRSITDLGGRETFPQRRLERLEANRRQPEVKERDRSQPVAPRVEETPRRETAQPAQRESTPQTGRPARQADERIGRGQATGSNLPRTPERQRPQIPPQQPAETTPNTQASAGSPQSVGGG